MFDINAPHARAFRQFSYSWRFITWLIWLVAALVLVQQQWPRIVQFALPDTDDNMRLMQLRAFMHGQSWFDLRQYALNTPYGANIHWSRLVDMPLVALISLARLFSSPANAELFACVLAPLLPLYMAMLACGGLVRRLVSPYAYPIGALAILASASAVALFSPLRIDHHSWQLTFLMFTLLGLQHEDKVRGGLMAGGATACSLIIGLEMIPFLALGGLSAAGLWIMDNRERVRLRFYSISLSLCTLLGYFAFASYDNRGAVCDALSPVWASSMVVAGGLGFGLSWVKHYRFSIRMGLGVLAGGVLAFFFMHTWPNCLGALEHVSPEAQRIWLNRVNEAQPIFHQSRQVQFTALAMPMLALIGVVLAIYQARDWKKHLNLLVLFFFTLSSMLLCFWQTRFSASADMLAITGVALLLYSIVSGIWRGNMAVITSSCLGAGALLALWMWLIILPAYSAPQAQTKTAKAPNANAQCWYKPNLAALDKIPAGTMFTHVDLAPRLISTTSHHAIMGPYHRNAQNILDVYHAFGAANEAQAHALMAHYHARYLLLCPGMNETTQYHSLSPNGFYDKLMAGQVPAWLTPIDLPKGSPFKLWSISA
jgi:hypothetical protein